MSADPEPAKRRGRPPSGGREAILRATLELIRERGIANVTSREIAARAGVSDASVYYHFSDRPGLMRAVFEQGVQPLEFMNALQPGGSDRHDVLRQAESSLESFFREVLPILHAAQSDPELGTTLSVYIRENDMGPHKGVRALGDYLRGEQEAGRVNPAADVEAVATIVINNAYSRVERELMLAHSEEKLPSTDRLLAEINRLLD